MTCHIATNSIIHFLTVLAALATIFLLWRFRKSSEVKYLIYLEFFVAIWACTYALEFSYPDLETKILWSKMSYFGIAFLAVFYFLFTTAFSRKKNIINKKTIALLLIIPVITIALVLTNEKHLLIWQEVKLDPEKNMAHYSHGIGFWFFWVYSTTLLILGLYNLLSSNSNFSAYYKNQASTLLVASLFPVTGNLMYLTNVNPYPGFDWTPVSFVLTGIIVALGIFRFRMFDIVPLARTKLFEIINDGVVIINNEGFIEDCNSPAYSIFNWQDKSIIHEHYGKIFKQYEKLTSALSDNLASIQLEVSHENKRNLYHVKVSPFYRNKKLSGNILLFHDITSIVEAEEMLINTNKKLLEEIEKREKLIEDLDSFAHTVAHDLRNSLSSIFSASEIMEELIKQNDKNLLSELSILINQSAKKSIQITHELLLLATTNKTEVEIYPLDMARIFNESKGQLTDLIKSSNVVFTEPAKWPLASGYAPWIEEVWSNYLSNAIKYGGVPPKIEVGADVLINGKVKFWIKDNGKGLTNQQQNLLFKNFVRLDTKKADGYGLGLSIVKKIIEKLGGSVGVESTGNGDGSKFFFILPASQQKSYTIGMLNPKTELIAN
ncbi:MAG: signal-transducing histidine [Prolixibacteraceae bacterium]|nr:MAG: signal-transducing histidine [Prolixibacteraceae bacterium]